MSAVCAEREISVNESPPANESAQAIAAGNRNSGGDSPLDRFFYVCFLAGLIALSCILGMLAAALDLAPYRTTKNALAALESLHRRMELRAEELPPYLWTEGAVTERGVTVHDLHRSSPGLTLYGSAHESSMILMDLSGREVYRWEAPCQRVWAGAKHLTVSLPEKFVHIRRGHVFDNGDLLALYETPLHTPNGIGLAKLNRHGKVVWRLEKHAHHDFDIAENGTIYVLTHRVLADPHPDMPFLGSPVIDDCLSIVSPAGVEEKTISLMSSFGRSSFCRRRTIYRNAHGDSFHSNTVNIVGDEFAAHYGDIEASDLMICAREINLVFVVRPATAEIVWASTGPWHHPHDPDPLPNGNLLIFDNCFARGDFSGSRVLEFNPRSGNVVWEFAGNHANGFASDVRGCQQRLDNGNTLITESVPGRLREVACDGEIVWEFVNPVRGGKHNDYIPILVGAERIDPRSLGFLDAEIETDGGKP